MQKVFNLMALTSFVVSVTIAAGGFWLYKSRDVMIENAKEQVCLLYTSPSPRD